MTAVTHHIQVLLNLTGRSEYFCPQSNVMDMKAEMGFIHKAMIRSGISFDKSPNEFGGVATVIRPQKHLSPRSSKAHARMAGMKSHDFERILRIKESEASVDHREPR
jgi:hypothetical protein